MLSHRHALAAILLAALHPVSELRSEPLEPASAAGPEKAMETAAASAESYYRMGTAGQRNAGPFGLATMVRPGVARGTTAWLSRGAAAEPLSSSYASPHAARKEVGISYSSDGRVNAYLAERERPAEPGTVQAFGQDRADGAAVTRSAYYAKGTENASVASLLGQLKTKGLRLSLEDGWKLTAGARSREYSNSALNTRVAHITLQRWWGEVSTAYSLQVEKRGGWNVAPSQSFQLGYAFAPRSTVGVAYTTGQEHAFFGAQGMLKTEVRSFALQAEHTVKKDWSVRFDAGHYNHGDLPSHRAIRISLSRSLW